MSCQDRAPHQENPAARTGAPRGTAVARRTWVIGALRRWFFVGGVTILAGCEPAYGASDVKTMMNGRALLVSAIADEELSWSGWFKIERAPRGEYLIFASEHRPSSPVSLAGFDPAVCPDRCEVSGLRPT